MTPTARIAALEAELAATKKAAARLLDAWSERLAEKLKNNESEG